MPPKAKFTKNEILDTAFEIARTHGIDKITSRELGKCLGSSPGLFLRYIQIWRN